MYKRNSLKYTFISRDSLRNGSGNTWFTFVLNSFFYCLKKMFLFLFRFWWWKLKLKLLKSGLIPFKQGCLWTYLVVVGLRNTLSNIYLPRPIVHPGWNPSKRNLSGVAKANLIINIAINNVMRMTWSVIIISKRTAKNKTGCLKNKLSEITAGLIGRYSLCS